MDVKTARRFLDRWNVWVQNWRLGPMKRLAKTIMAKAEGILRSIATSPNGVLEAINGNVQAAKRKAKGPEPSEISRPSSTSSPETSWPTHPLEIATSPLGPGHDPGEPEVEFRESVLAATRRGDFVSRATRRSHVCRLICHFRSSGVHGRRRPQGSLRILVRAAGIVDDGCRKREEGKVRYRRRRKS